MATKRSNPVKPRKQDDDMLVIRGRTDIKPPTPAEIQKMKNREYMRKHPHTSV